MRKRFGANVLYAYFTKRALKLQMFFVRFFIFCQIDKKWVPFLWKSNKNQKTG